MKETIRYLSPHIRQYRWKYIAGVIFLLFTNTFRIINPRVIQAAIDYLKDNFDLVQVGIYAALVVGVAIGEGIFLFLMRKSIIVASREIENDLRNQFFARLLTLPPRFYQQMPTGDIMARATNDLTAVRSLLGPGIAYSTNTIFAFFFVIPMMISISPRLTALALLPFPLIAVLVNRFGKAIYKRFERIQAQFSVLSNIAQENLAGNSIVKWFTREDYEIERFREASREHMRRNIDHARVQAAFHPSIMFSVGISTVVIIWIGGQLIMEGRMSLGEFTAFVLYMGILVWPAIALGWVIGLFQQGSASLKRMRKILEETSELEVENPISPVEPLQGEIRFANLTFGYEPETPVLQEIDLTIPARSTVGIIGPTGCGKSTLVKLIPHLYKLPDNQLFLDGRDINQLSLKYLRSNIGYVPQETFLFSDTIRSNIAYGRPEATQEEIEHAARMADIHEQITEFPEGYDSMLGERGINLSGGQKQRVAIARAILCNPSILILDDAFSALDTQTEDRILNSLEAFFPDRTVILVSHRVSTLQNADTILVMDEGRIVEQGVHADLIGAGGLYEWIYQKQLLEEELERVE